MATLATDKARVFEDSGANPVYNELPVIATDIIYAGAAVGESSSAGTARPLAAGDNFLGFCIEKVDNSAGAAAAKTVKLLARGSVWLTVTNGDNIDDLGVTVYASDDDTFTTASTSNTAIGKIIRYDSTRTNKCLVAFEALGFQSL